MATTAAPVRTSALRKLYRGENRYDVLGRRKWWYGLSAILIIAGAIGLGVRGLNESIDFKGGDTFQFSANGHSMSDVDGVLSKQHIAEPVVQRIGEDQIKVTTKVLPTDSSDDEVASVQTAIAQEFGLQQNQVSVQSVGASWGSDITKKAVEGLVIFLLAVIAYIAFRFEGKMAVAAIVALIHDLVITVGIYALVGFQVSPSTVIAVLTILGFSLYDTVVVFDRVRETTADLGPRSNRTYTTAANLAVNETLMRSINTSLISLLPVAALLFVGAGLLGAGTLKDLALAQFIGLAAGAYSSIFIATPLLAQLKEREPAMGELRKRVAFLAEKKPEALDPLEAVAAGIPVELTKGRKAAAGEAEDEPEVPASFRTEADSLEEFSEEAAPSAGPLQQQRVPGSPMVQRTGRKRGKRGRPSGKRR